MGTLWFDVLADFWTYGQVADKYGILKGIGNADFIEGLRYFCSTKKKA